MHFEVMAVNKSVKLRFNFDIRLIIINYSYWLFLCIGLVMLALTKDDAINWDSLIWSLTIVIIWLLLLPIWYLCNKKLKPRAVIQENATLMIDSDLYKLIYYTGEVKEIPVQSLKIREKKYLIKHLTLIKADTKLVKLNIAGNKIFLKNVNASDLTKVLLKE